MQSQLSEAHQIWVHCRTVAGQGGITSGRFMGRAGHIMQGGDFQEIYPRGVGNFQCLFLTLIQVWCDPWPYLQFKSPKFVAFAPWLALICDTCAICGE